MVYFRIPDAFVWLDKHPAVILKVNADVYGCRCLLQMFMVVHVCGCWSLLQMLIVVDVCCTFVVTTVTPEQKVVQLILDFLVKTQKHMILMFICMT